MSKVYAKFKCLSVKEYVGTVWDENGENPKQGTLYAYEFQAVTGTSAENKHYFASTPTGEIKIAAVRSDLYKPGGEYYVEFVPAEVI